MTLPNAGLQASDEEGPTFHDVVSGMKRHTWTSLAQVCGAFDQRAGELVGSGTFIDYGETTFLLTAEHVGLKLFEKNINGSRKYPEGLCHSVGNGELLAYVTKPWFSYQEPEDLAVTPIPPIVLGGTDRLPISVEKLAEDNWLADDDFYFVHGFTDDESRFIVFFEGVVSKSFAYGGRLAETEPPLDPSIHFAITFPQNGTENELGEPVDLPVPPEGLSGSTVWKTNRLSRGASWTPEDARIAGIAIRYDQVNQCVIVTRAEHIRRLLKDAADSLSGASSPTIVPE